MTTTFVFIGVLGIFAISYLIMGLLVSHHGNNSSGYFLAGRNLSLSMVTFTLIATQLGGGMLLGTSQEAYRVGIAGIMYTLGICLGLLILGLGIAAKLQSLGVSTTAELFTTRYGSPALTKIASLLSITTLCGILIAQIVASKSVFASVGLDGHIAFILFWAFIIISTVLGGLEAVVLSDFFQVIYIIVIFGGIVAWGIITNPQSFWSIFSFHAPQTISTPVSSYNWVGIILMPALFCLIEQDLAQRFFAARTQKVAIWAALLASLGLFLFALVPVYLGIQAHFLPVQLALNASPLIPVIKLLTNDIVVALSLFGILAAITSTADSLLCAISSNIAQDFNLLGASRAVSRAQLITLITGVIVFGISFLVPSSVIGILIGSYELSVCCMLIPLLVAYARPSITSLAAYGACIGGLIGFVAFKIYPIALPREVASLVLSGAGFLIGLALDALVLKTRRN